MRLISIFLSCILCFCAANTALAQSVSAELLELEQTAKNLLHEDKPKKAVGVYHQYVLRMTEEGWSTLQPDLLNNLAIAHYRAGNLGAAMASLKQLSIVKDSARVQNEIDDLQMLIEHRAYQTAPNTAFVRGQSSDYLVWETVHRFSGAQLNAAVIMVWTLLCCFVGLYFMIPKLRKSRFIFGMLMAILSIFMVCIGMFTFQHYQTDDRLYGVLMKTSSLRHEPSYDAPRVEDPAFVPGITVGVVSSVEDWLKIERMDGVTCWMDSHDFYLLRGVGDSRSAHLKPYEE